MVIPAIDLQEPYVSQRVSSDDLGFMLAAVGGSNDYLNCIVDDVFIGNDVSVR